MKEFCKGCQSDQYIVNRTKMLCQRCNHFRLHKETPEETLIKQNQKYLERLKEKPYKPIKSVTKKQSRVNNLLSELKLDIRKQAQQEDMYYCWGCGKGGVDLDCSHILSVKQREDLELDRENINLFCRDCHNNWESWVYSRMSKLLTFEKDLEYIKRKDNTTYQRILLKKIIT